MGRIRHFMVGDSNASSLNKRGGAKSGAVPAPMDPLAYMDIPNLPALKLNDRQPRQQGPSQVGRIGRSPQPLPYPA